MKLLIKGGRVIDPANNIDGARDILVENGVVARVAEKVEAAAEKVIDAAGMVVMPGVVDMHVHLREPGREDKETVASGTQAALRGGVTSLLAMPNTYPAMDSPENIRLLSGLVKKAARVNVYACGAITRERKGVELVPMQELVREGAVAFSDDGASVDDPALLARAFAAARSAGKIVICHCEDKVLSGHGVVNRGLIATRMGLRGISDESEYARVERDIRIAEQCGAPVHIAHVSCRESVQAIAAAKKRGVKVTAETAPHYFTFIDQDVLGYDTNMKMNPPLRSAEDRKAVIEGLKDGTIDCIASDHAPHTEGEKDIEFDRAEFGVIGLETELPASITALVRTNALTWKQLAEKLCLNPARVLGIPKGTLGQGAAADITLVDPGQSAVVAREHIASKSKNSSFLGRTLYGVVRYTIVSGELRYSADAPPVR